MSLTIKVRLRATCVWLDTDSNNLSSATTLCISSCGSYAHSTTLWFFSLVLTLNGSAIKVDKVHRWLGLGSMYSESCLATGWDARRALLDKGECNGGTYPDCTVHSMQEVGLATTTNVNTCYVRIMEHGGSLKRSARTVQLFRLGASW